MFAVCKTAQKLPHVENGRDHAQFKLDHNKINNQRFPIPIGNTVPIVSIRSIWLPVDVIDYINCNRAGVQRNETMVQVELGEVGYSNIYLKVFAIA